MADPDEILLQRSAALAEVAARVPGGVVGLTCARDADVVDLVAAAQAVVRSAEGILAAAAGEVARRSQGRGDETLARRLGERSASGLVARTAAVSFGAASRLVEVGEMIRPTTAISGEDLPADRPHIAAAVLAGDLALDLAVEIDQTVRKVAHRLLLDEGEQLEASLVARATSGTWSVLQFVPFCRQIPNRLDPDHADGRGDDLRARASIRETRLPNGMLRIVAELDPERAAFYLAAIRAHTNPRKQADSGGNVTDLHGKTADRVEPSPAESKLDAFVSILRDSIKTADGKTAGVDTTILVRITLEELLSGIDGIDGIGEPIPASDARRLAAEADLNPQVFDGKSQLLDHGEARRVFTKAQRYAILAAFTGCAFPQCDIPSSMVEFHHIGSWATRHRHRHGTDLANGIPLCAFHNRLMERGWRIELDDDRILWFTPPLHIDWAQRPRRGGNLARQHAA